MVASHAQGNERTRLASAFRILIVAVALVVLCVVLSSCYSGYLEEYTESSSLQKATVESIVDGDTLWVNIDGESYKVRLIGIDSPESVHYDSSKNTSEGIVASDYMKSLITEGQTVYLQEDTSDTDLYGRLLRYVWLVDPGSKIHQIDAVRSDMVNGILVYEGYAQSKRYKPDTAYNDIFDELQADAVANGRGVSYMWEE